MTGKDIVLFIIKNDLLEVDLNTKVGDVFYDVEEAAVKLGVSIASLEDMINRGIIDHIEIDNQVLLHKDVVNKFFKKERL